MGARYITTTLPYVNANPHLGHALEFVEADCLARAARLAGDEVFFNIGTDEHGAKVAKNAEKEGRDTQEYVDDYSGRFKSFADKLNISYDSFIRTTDPIHIRAAQEFWKRCVAKGDIYKAEYEIKYCVGCELEKTDSELVDGCCSLHTNLPIEIRKEENYYFKFSKYRDELLSFYEKNPDFVVPSERLGEITALAKTGFKDFSISRRREKLSWGIPVPGDEEHVMYVWFDALVNYVSAIGWPEDEKLFKKWWPVIQLAGKDNLRQQAAMWQAMLLSAGLPLSRQIFIHGFITSGGQKMSKTLGNIIDPMVVAEKYGVDALRYILLRHASPFEDSDLTLETIHNLYTDHLTNGLGNLVSRVVKMATLYEVVLAHPELKEIDELLAESLKTEEHQNLKLEEHELDFAKKRMLRDEFYKHSRIALKNYNFSQAMDFIWAAISWADSYIQQEKPFKKIKVNAEEAKGNIKTLLEDLYQISIALEPFMPQTALKIQKVIKNGSETEGLFPRI